VRSVARRPLPPHPKLRHTEADIRDPVVRRALGGCDVLVHLGFQLWRSPDAEGTNLGGTANVVAAAPSRIVLASSAAVYGAWPDNPVPVDERWVPRPNRECAYASHKLEAERRCADAAPTAALRICSVLGPHADALVRKATAGLRRVIPAARGRRQAVQFLHEDDAATAVLAAVHESVDGVYNIAPEDWLDEHAVATIAGGRVVRLPLGLLVRGSNLAARLHLMGFGADRAIFLNGPVALDPGRAFEAFRWRAERDSAQVLQEFLGSSAL
jgi:nucleoside-diphosphate-sugar epimerase